MDGKQTHAHNASENLCTGVSDCCHVLNLRLVPHQEDGGVAVDLATAARGATADGGCSATHCRPQRRKGQ